MTYHTASSKEAMLARGIVVLVVNSFTGNGWGGTKCHKTLVVSQFSVLVDIRGEQIVDK